MDELVEEFRVFAEMFDELQEETQQFYNDVNRRSLRLKMKARDTADQLTELLEAIDTQNLGEVGGTVRDSMGHELTWFLDRIHDIEEHTSEIHLKAKQRSRLDYLPSGLSDTIDRISDVKQIFEVVFSNVDISDFDIGDIMDDFSHE
jgi:DNA mismatch repair ATPase MutS